MPASGASPASWVSARCPSWSRWRDRVPSSTADRQALLERCRFPAAGAVVGAVSGGADSLALLVLAVAAGLEVTAVRRGVGLRAAVEAEVEVVADAAVGFGASLRAVGV